MDRVAFDERPDELGDLTPNRRESSPPNKKASDSPRHSPRRSADEDDDR
jgi:hypothetical protein